MMLILTTLFSILILPKAGAATDFGVSVIVCDTSWYCTGWSGSTCGTRTCIDANACGINYNKPGEFLECPEVPSQGRGNGGGGGGGMYIPISSLIPPGYFTLDLSIMKLEIPQNTVVQKILKINSSTPEDYTLEILYPSSYTRGTEFVTTSVSNKHIETSGDFNIIVDARNIMIGTYSIPINISNKKYYKVINAVIDVIPKNDILMEVSLDSNIKNLGVDTQIKIYTDIKGMTLRGNENIEYIILDPKGNVLYTEEKPLNNSLHVEDTLTLPSMVDEGYYVMSVKIMQETDEYIKSKTFTVLPKDKYLLTLEEPTYAIIKSQMIVGILTIILAIIILINAGLFYRKHQKYKVHKMYNRYASTGKISKPLISINLGIGEAIKKIFLDKRKKKVTPESRLEVLRNTYERGFISLLEYRNALRDAGYLTESNKIWEQYNVVKKAEKTEDKASAKESARQEDVKAKTEEKPAGKKEEAKIEEKDKGILDKVGELFKKEEPKKDVKEEHAKESKEIIHEKIIESKADKITEKQKEESLERKSIEEEPVPKTSEKSIIGALSHLFAQNPFDKRVQDDQAFVLHGNERLYCIRDLLNALPNMSEYVFHHHTLHGRNDFSNWIGDVFRYYDLAEEIKNTKSKEDMISVLKKYE